MSNAHREFHILLNVNGSIFEDEVEFEITFQNLEVEKKISLKFQHLDEKEDS